jgi:PIN domain nuclease of toxin-antitoxin system
MLNLDTNIVVFLLQDELTPEERKCLLADAEWAVSDIVLWELAKLIQLGRLKMNLDSPEFRTFLQALTVIPISLEIAKRSTDLDFTSDPADEIIAATSIVEKLPLLTRDARILKSKKTPLALKTR